MTSMSAEALLRKCIDLAGEKKAENMISLQLSELTTISDYFLLVTASNTRQAKSISDNIELAMKAESNPPLRIEGYREGHWILMDFSAVVVHIFLEEDREYYDLEHLWGDAPREEY